MSPIQLLSILSAVFPVLAGSKKHRGILWWYAVVAFLSDLLMTSFKRILYIPHKPIGYTFLLIEFLILSLFYRQYFSRGKSAILVIILVASVYYLGSTSLLSRYDDQMNAFFAFMYIVYSINGLYQILSRQEELHLEKSFFFWINTAFLIYGAGTFLLFLLRDYLMKKDLDFYTMLWMYAFASLNILKNLFLGIGITQQKSNPYETSNGSSVT